MKNKIIKNYIIIQCWQKLLLGIFLPVLSLFQIARGLNLLEIGITMSCYTASVVLLEIPTGLMADFFNKKKIFVFSLFALLSSTLIFIFSDSLILLATGFSFFGIYRAISSGSIEAVFVDTILNSDSVIDLQKAYARVNIFSPLGLSTGAILSGAIPILTKKIFPETPEPNIYTGNFIIMFLLSAGLIIFTILVFKPEKQLILKKTVKIIKYRTIFKETLQQTANSRILFLLVISMFIWGITFTGIELFWQPKLKVLMGTDFRIWIISFTAILYFLSASVGNLLITPIYRFFRQNGPLLLLILRVSIGACLLVLTFQTRVAGFTTVFVILNILSSLTISPHKKLLNSAVPAEIRSTILSVESFAIETGGLIGALLSGLLSENYSINHAWIGGAVILMLSGFLFSAAVRSR